MASIRRHHPPPGRRGGLERGITALVEAERQAAVRRAGQTARAVQEERLRRMEQDLTELRGRVNGLIFLAAGTVVTQVFVRLMG